MSPPVITSLARPVLRLQPDERVVRLIREGHDAAFEEIVRRYRDRLVGFAATIVPPARAEDVVQESLAKAYVAIGSSEAELRLRPWLFTIVRNTALNSLRDEPAHAELHESLAGAAQPPEVAERHARLAELIAGLEALPESQRRALVMRELEGRGHAEIASELGSSQGAVRQLIFRARLGLREGLGLLIPLPLVRMLLDAQTANAATVGGGLAGSAALGAGAAGGAGGGAAFKAGAVLVAAVLAVGTEMALDGDTRIESSKGSPGGPGVAESRPRSEDPVRADLGDDGSVPERSGPSENSGPSASSGPGPNSGPGGGGDDGADDEGEQDHSGPGGGGDDEPEAGDSSGPGSGDADELDADSSGPGSGELGSGDDNSGPSDSSGSSGSGSGDDSSGSGSTGSGSTGSGSGDDSSGSGSTGDELDGGDSSGSGSGDDSDSSGSG